ncbi:hypothetical protein ABZZ18_39940, partial [Streptomyces canus]
MRMLPDEQHQSPSDLEPPDVARTHDGPRTIPGGTTHPEDAGDAVPRTWGAAGPPAPAEPPGP